MMYDQSDMCVQLVLLPTLPSHNNVCTCVCHISVARGTAVKQPPASSLRAPPLTSTVARAERGGPGGPGNGWRRGERFWRRKIDVTGTITPEDKRRTQHVQTINQTHTSRKSVFFLSKKGTSVILKILFRLNHRVKETKNKINKYLAITRDNILEHVLTRKRM